MARLKTSHLSQPKLVNSVVTVVTTTLSGIPEKKLVKKVAEKFGAPREQGPDSPNRNGPLNVRLTQSSHRQLNPHPELLSTSADITDYEQTIF